MDNNYGLISLIAGILSIICSFSGVVLQILGIPIGVVGFWMAKKSLNQEPGNGLGRAGLITSIIGIVLCSLLFVACVACAGVFGFLINSL